MLLNRHLYEKLCDLNKAYLRDQNVLIDEYGPDIELDENQTNQLIENEKSHAKDSKENYQKGKHKAKHINMLLISALALLGGGFTLAPLFIVSPIVIPIIPVLLFGIAIIAITKFFLNVKINRLEIKSVDAANFSNKLEKDKGDDGNFREEIINGVQEVKSVIESVVAEIGAQKESNSHNFSQLLAKLGTFPTIPIPIPRVDQANETLHNTATMSSSPTNN